jgi:catechol 2,3-dioxygenase-like lactoylglutathione lyase family enzyme
MFGGVNPIFRVREIDASIAYYLEKLGFQLLWRASPGFACVARGKCQLFLCDHDQGHPGGWVWIGAPDAEAVWEEYRLAGAILRHPPTNYEWALECQVEDLDGNVLRIGSDPKPGEPTGEWLDMNRVRWIPLLGGGWAKVED